MLPSIEEMQEFVKEIPPTPEGKIAAMNKFFLKEKDSLEAMHLLQSFMKDLLGNNPDYAKVLRNCKTEEEIKQATAKFFEDNPKMVEETLLSMLAVKRDQWEKKENER